MLAGLDASVSPCYGTVCKQPAPVYVHGQRVCVCASLMCVCTALAQMVHALKCTHIAVAADVTWGYAAR